MLTQLCHGTIMDQWATYPDYDYEEAGDVEDPEYADYYEEYVSNIKIFHDLHIACLLQQ